MKIWSRIALIAAFISSAGLTHELFAAPACLCTLDWQSSPDSGVAGYALYYGVAGSPLTNRLDVGPVTTATLNNLTAFSSYYFYVVAYDTNQVESGPSNLLPYGASAISSVQLSQLSNGTMNLAFQVAPVTACHIEYTDTMSPPVWKVLTAAISDSNGLVTISDPVTSNGSRFYRAVVP